MCEKPMCTRADQARELVRLAREKGLHLLVPYGWHYKPFVRQAKRWMDEGRIGEVQYALCHMASPMRALLQGQRLLVEDVSGKAEFQVDLRLFGSEGMLLLDCERARLELHRHDGRSEKLQLPEGAGAYSCEGPPANFVDLVLGKTTENLAPGEAAMRSVELLD